MILVVAAMKEEIKEIIKYPHQNVRFLVTGVGKVNAAMKLTEVIQHEQITSIYNFGFAGATSAYQVGDMVVIEDAIYHDFDLTMFDYQKGQVPGYPPKFQSDDELVRQASMISNTKKGHLFTGDVFFTKPTTEEMIVDMEGAALYQVAHTYHIPIISIKVVSDIIGMDQHIENYKRFEAEQGAQALCAIYKKVIKGE